MGNPFMENIEVLTLKLGATTKPHGILNVLAPLE